MSRIVDIFPTESTDECEECGDWVAHDPDLHEDDAVLCRRCACPEGDPPEHTYLADEALIHEPWE